jgi:hypothetical protein
MSEHNDTAQAYEPEHNIQINGITFTTKEAFAKYREQHTFRVGDAVNVMTKEYSEVKVYPGFITGISDFGNNKVSIHIAYISGYSNELKFGEIYSDECEVTTSEITGIAPINEFNDMNMRLSDCIARMERTIAAKKAEIEGIQKHVSRLREFAANIAPKQEGGLA